MSNKNKTLKITPILITINIVLLLVMASYYIYRAVYYYLEENGERVGSDIVYLGSHIIKQQSYLDETKGLVYNDEKNIYTYKGNVKDNYLYYSGIMFRIIGIDNENNVRAVVDKNLTIMYSGLEKGYDKSYIRKWMNILEDTDNSGIFMNNLYSSDEILSHSYICNDVIDDVTKITCDDNTNNDYVSLLSLNDYSAAGGKESYLNNGENFYLNTVNSDNNNYIVSTSGDIVLNNIYTRAYGVRPVITINANTNLYAGDGTEKNPYIIEKHQIEVLSDAYVGEYVNLSGQNYKIISLGEKVLLAGVDAIKDEEKYVESKFGSTSKYAASSTVGKYLNDKFYNSLEEKDLLIRSHWYVGSNSMSNLDYGTKYSAKIGANVGMLSLGDLFIHEVTNVFTMTRGIESDIVIEVINEDGNLYGDLVNKSYGMRPAFYLSGNLLLDSGEGTIEKPYVLGGEKDVEETEGTEETKEE